MKLRVNGEELETVEALSLRQLLELLRLPVDGVAVAVNQEVVPRGQQPQKFLTDGDRIEVIRAVGGG